MPKFKPTVNSKGARLLREWLEEHKLNSLTGSNRLGCTPSQLWNWATSRVMPSIPSGLHLQEETGIPLADWVSPDAPTYQVPLPSGEHLLRLHSVEYSSATRVLYVVFAGASGSGSAAGDTQIKWESRDVMPREAAEWIKRVNCNGLVWVDDGEIIDAAPNPKLVYYMGLPK